MGWGPSSSDDDLTGLLFEDEDEDEVLASPAGGAIVAIDQAGQIYEGDLISDILEYRLLRGASLRGTPLSSLDLRRLADLEQRMTPAKDGSSDSELRMFYRFECRFEAFLQPGRSREPVVVTVEDISAGGVKLSPDQDVQPGEQVTLMVEVTRQGIPGRAVLPGRVAWKKVRSVGIMFAGPPRWESNDDEL